MRCKVHGRNKKGGVHKAPPAGLYSGTCSKMISHYIDSLLIYADDHLLMYADDHQIYISDNEILKATQTLRRQIEAVSQWYKENLL